jgi:hypothetical protein
MAPIFSALLLVTQPPSGDECVYNAVPVVSRASIGESVLAKRSKDAATLDALTKAIDECSRQNHWSVESALHANGSAAMRFAADRIAQRLAHPSWSDEALKAIRTRPPEQIQNLAKTGSGGAEFELVLTRMIAADRTIGEVLGGASKETFESFVLMIKLLSISEIERVKI